MLDGARGARVVWGKSGSKLDRRERGSSVVGGVCGCDDAHRLHVGGCVRGATALSVAETVAEDPAVKHLAPICVGPDARTI